MVLFYKVSNKNKQTGLGEWNIEFLALKVRNKSYDGKKFSFMFT
jgi:hypothetical protein